MGWCHFGVPWLLFSGLGLRLDMTITTIRITAAANNAMWPRCLIADGALRFVAAPITRSLCGMFFSASAGSLTVEPRHHDKNRNQANGNRTFQ